MTTPLLDIQNLKTYFYTRAGVVKAVNGISLTINKGEVIGIVGESGSGKSVTGFPSWDWSILRARSRAVPSSSRGGNWSASPNPSGVLPWQ